jgi:hypothetical protein
VLGSDTVVTITGFLFVFFYLPIDFELYELLALEKSIPAAKMGVSSWIEFLKPLRADAMRVKQSKAWLLWELSVA